MEKLKGFVIIILCNLVGDIIITLSGLPLPGSVLGLIFLLALLMLKVVKLETVEPAAMLLTGWMMLFILPGGVRMMNSFSKFKGILVQVLLVAVLSTLLSLLATGFTAQGLAKGKKKAGEGEKLK